MRNRKYDIEKYLRGELSPAEMHALEKEALSDPFLAEALEGIEQAGADNFLFDLHKINRSVHDRMRMKGRKNNKVVRIWGWTTAVAATILLVVVSGFVVLNLLRDQNAREQSITASSEQAPAGVQADSASVKNETGRPPLAQLQEKEKEEKPATSVPSTRQSARKRDAARQTQQESKIKRSPTALPDTAQHPLNDNLLASGATSTADESIAEESLPEETTAHQETLARQEEEAVARRKKLSSTGTVTRSLEGHATQRPAPHTSLKVIRGHVTDEEGQELPGVNVVVKNTEMATVTNFEGAYEVMVPNDEATLVFNFIGFEPKEVDVAGDSDLNVTLEENIATLSEVVVTGYGERRATDQPFQAAEPAVGKNGFKSYLKQSVKYPQEAIKNKVEGKVTIQFTVGASGSLTDFQVLRGIGYGCEEELIRAIKQGPEWKPGSLGDEVVTDRVRVRYKFELPN